MFAFEKALESDLTDPLRQPIIDLLTRVRGGMPPDRALDLLWRTIDHEHFRDLITAIRFNFRYRGDLPVLLEQMEMQLQKIEQEYDRRRLTNARDLTLTLLILLAVPALFAIRLAVNADSRAAFLNSAFGLTVLVACLLLYGSAFIAFLLIRRQIAG